MTVDASPRETSREPIAVVYTLSRAEIARAATERSGQAPRRARIALVVNVANLVNIAGLAWRSWLHAEYRSTLWLLCFELLFIAGWIVLLLTGRGAGGNVVRAAALRIGDAGIAGHFDGEGDAIPWRAVESVRDAGDAFVVNRRGFGRVLVLPKRAIADPSEVWRRLDFYLTATRGLVRPAARTTLWNTKAAG